MRNDPLNLGDPDEATKALYDAAPEIADAAGEITATTAESMSKFVTETPQEVGANAYRFVTEQPPSVNPDREEMRERY